MLKAIADASEVTGDPKIEVVVEVAGGVDLLGNGLSGITLDSLVDILIFRLPPMLTRFLPQLAQELLSHQSNA